MPKPVLKRRQDKERHQKLRKKLPGTSNSSSNPNRKASSKGQLENFRTKSTINRINMYRDKPNIKEMWKTPDKAARIEPDRRWFGNTRTITQKDLEKFRHEYSVQKKDPYSVLIHNKKLPISLLTEPSQENQMNILEMESFGNTFGPNARRKRPKLSSYSLEGLVEDAHGKEESYKVDKDIDLVKEELKLEKKWGKDKRMEAGQSKRIWEELYKVLDSSDVVVQVLDVRNPMGTRSPHVEKHLKRNAQHKHLVFVLNKCDLVPTWVTARWVALLSREYPTLAFNANFTKPFGKGALIKLLRQFDSFHQDKKNISVGFIGYPNVGKSSVINAVRSKKVCNVAPIPGETKVWQYITLTKRIYLIDCPGVVYDLGDNDAELVLKGVVRAEKIDLPSLYIPDLLTRTKTKYLESTYLVSGWDDFEDFLEKIARRTGRLLKGAEPDLESVARIVLMDWQRGKIPFFVQPPRLQDEQMEGEPENEDLKKLLPVEQKFRDIHVVNKFDKVDRKNDEEMDLNATNDNMEGANDGEDEDADEEEEAEEDAKDENEGEEQAEEKQQDLNEDAA